MGDIFLLAWRNIWRRPRRTILTIGSFAAGLWAIIVFFAIMDGMDYSMLENAIKAASGHIKIYAKGYREEPQLVKSIRSPGDIYQMLGKLPFVRGYEGRVDADALAATGDYSTGVWIIGLDPDREKEVSDYGKLVRQGRFIERGDHDGIVIGETLSRSLNANVGSTVSLILQAADGSLGAKNYRVRGILDMGDREMDRTAVIMDLEEAQTLTALGTGVSEIVVLLKDSSYTDRALAAIVSGIDMNRYEVFTWRELIASVVQLVKLGESFKYVLFIVLIVVVFFGILDTLLMSVTERTREFGIMLALGTEPARIVSLVMMETAFLCLAGIVAGIPAGLGTSALLGRTGIDLSRWNEALRLYPFHPTVIYPLVNAGSILWSLGVVVVPGTIASLFPALRASRLTPTAAIRRA
jgi:putative ABC transport system permease protein